MRKVKLKKKAFALSMGLAVMTLTATNLNAQYDGNRGLFGRGAMPESYNENGTMYRGTTGGYNISTELFGSGTNGGYQISTEQFGQSAPLGSGLFIMAAAGAAYAFKKRKKNN